MAVETSATISVLSAADRISPVGGERARTISCEKPDHTVGSPPSLKDSATSTAIGT